MTDAWVMRTEQCGTMGVYSSRKKGMLAAIKHLSEGLENWSLDKAQIVLDGSYQVILSCNNDYVTLERFKINLQERVIKYILVDYLRIPEYY